MSNHNLKLPEPILPEHLLIREAAPLPELSAGFKARVMAECAASMAQARRAQRWKIGGTVTAVCCLTLMLCLSLPVSPQQPSGLADQPSSPKAPYRTGPSGNYSPAGGKLAVDAPNSPLRKDSEKKQMNELMETLNGRQQMFDAHMLPKF